MENKNVNSAEKPSSCQGSMGLHQNNFKFQDRMSQLHIGAHENVIVEVFRRFRDHCMLKFKDGMNPTTKMSCSVEESIEPSTDTLEDGQDYSGQTTIDDLPFYCKMVILSKLETKDIHNLSMTSRHWNEVCGDQFLWRELLYRDMLKWHSVGHKSYPLISLDEYLELSSSSSCANNNQQSMHSSNSSLLEFDVRARLCCNKSINFKALHFHSSYQRQKDIQLIGVESAPDPDKNYEESEDSLPSTVTDQQLASTQSFPRFLRNLWMRMRSGDGEIIMLGPGMESPNTSKIFRRLLWARPDLLMTQRLLPGSQDGVGSGVELDFKGEKRFNLIALYSGNHRDRRRRFGLERLLHSNIVEQVEIISENASEAASSSQEDLPVAENGLEQKMQQPPIKFKLRDLVFNFLKQRADTYRLIYVVDATKGQPLIQLACNRHEIQAILEGIRTCENSVIEDGNQTDPEQRQNAENPVSAFASIMNFTGISTTNSSSMRTRRPLLVLCCVQSRQVERIACIEIALLLDLVSITDRPWYVQDISVDNLNGLENGLNWLFKQV